jgi:hypothetical protein
VPLLQGSGEPVTHRLQGLRIQLSFLCLGPSEFSVAIQQLYAYWILGGGAEPKEPRWSVMRNVLGWVD